MDTNDDCGRSRSSIDRAVDFIRRTPKLSAVAGLVEERDVDAFVVSFPKCGRTWLRLQLGRIFQKRFALDVADLIEVQDMAARNRAIPRVRFTHPDRPQERKAGELSAASVDRFMFRRVVLLIRDPRDVVVSMYHERTKRGMKPEFNGSLSEFIHEPVGSFDTIIAFYNLWAMRRRSERRVLVVRYEDMHEDPARELRKVLSFIGLGGIGDELVADAVAFTRFDRMHDMERKDSMHNQRLSPGDPADPDSFKTRKGEVGSYHDSLTDEEIASLNARMRTSLRAFYSPTPDQHRASGPY